MEQAMQELTNTALTFAIYGVLFMAALTILKIIFYRSTIGKLLGSGNRRRRDRRRRKAEDASQPPKEPVVNPEAKREKSDRNYSEELMDQGDAYIARNHLMTPTERDVFKVLEKAYGDKYHIFCQVRVVDIIQPNTWKYHAKSREYMSLFRQLSQWHFDYVLCHREGFKVFCALELDDPSHERPDRMKRDRIINRVCKEAGLRLERMVVDHRSQEVRLVDKVES